MEWSAEQYVRRVIVDVAARTGQPVRAVAQESFALTLWTYGDLAQQQREAAIERMGERTDLAGLVAVAFHEPQALQKAEFRYLRAAGRLSAMMDAQRARLTALAAQMAKAKVVDPEPADGG